MSIIFPNYQEWCELEDEVKKQLLRKMLENDQKNFQEEGDLYQEFDRLSALQAEQAQSADSQIDVQSGLELSNGNDGLTVGMDADSGLASGMDGGMDGGVDGGMGCSY